MKILILTTNTDHHLFFVNKLKEKFENISVILEKKKNYFSFKTNHNYEKKRKKFEKYFFFKNKNFKFKNEKTFYDINNINCINYVKKINPELIISFGIGLIKLKFLKEFKKSKIVNLHGGNLNFYRGLDSHLWTIYHNDFSNLLTTLHFVKKKLDTGNIILTKKISVHKKLLFESIRAYYTINCIGLVTKYIRSIKNNKKIPIKINKNFGRYYSAIPSVLIDKCIKNYNDYIKKK